MTLAGQSTICNNQQQRLSCRPHVKSTLKDSVPINSGSINEKDKYSVDNNITCERKTTAVRKGLGCRRSLKDMLSPEEQQVNQSGDDKQHDETFAKRQLGLSRKSARSLHETKPRRRLIFTSPRVVASDEDLFPSDLSLYKDSTDRWQQISDQAGSHRQDGTVMNIGRRPSNANAFRMGMIGCAAVRVRSLNLWVDHEKDTLCEWLEMIADIFVNLEHLTLTEDIFPGEDDMAVSARMRRLYVLSILPNLKSIDDMVVTSKERGMANPGSCKHQLRSNEFERQSPSSKATGAIDVDLKAESKPILIDTDSVRTCRANGIEVEFLSEKCWEVKQSETETTASTSPTSGSETTITATDSDDHYEFDAIAVTEVHSIDGKIGSSRDEDPTCNETLGQYVSAREREVDLIHQSSNNKPTGSTLSEEDNIQSTDDVRCKETSTRVRAFHSDSNNSIELVPIISADPECSEECDVSNVQRKKSSSSTIQLPLSSKNFKTEIEAPDSVSKHYPESVAYSRNEENDKKCGREPSIPKACTPVQRQSRVIAPTPQVGCCQILMNDGYETSQFSFPTSSRAVTRNASQNRFTGFGLSANQQLPPSQSLSSPFPMQFRERPETSSITTTTHLVVKTSDSRHCDPRGFNSGNCSTPIQNGIEVIVRPNLVITAPVSSPKKLTSLPKTAQKGELPPTCPAGKTRRKMASDYQPKKQKSRNRNQRGVHDVSRETARSTSVMDLDDEEEEFFDDFIENDQKRDARSDSRHSNKTLQKLGVSDFKN